MRYLRLFPVVVTLGTGAVAAQAQEAPNVAAAPVDAAGSTPPAPASAGAPLEAAPALLLDAAPAPAATSAAPLPLPPLASPAAPTASASAPPPDRGAAPLASEVASPPPTEKRLLVLDLAEKGGGAENTAAVSAAVAAQAMQSFAGSVVSTAQARVALEAAATQALLGCDTAACMTDVAQVMEADRVLGGSVSRAGDDLVLHILLVEASTGKLVEELTRKVPAYDDLFYYAAKEMTSFLLTGQVTDSRVPVRIESIATTARVIVDGQDRGVTPLTLPLDPGAHEIRVEAPGYASWRTLADVQDATPLRIAAELVSDKVSLWPAALTVGGIGVITAASALWTGAVALERYDGSASSLMPVWSHGILLGQIGAERSYLYSQPTDNLTLAQKKVDVETWRLASNLLWGTAGVLLVSAAALETADVILGADE